nr:hypothetical protein [Tanacetum cinerariifolium]
VNTKFLNTLPSEWSKFVTDVKLAKSLYTTNYDQLYAYLSQHEWHANEVRITSEKISRSCCIGSQISNSIPSISVTTTFRGIATTSKGNFTAGQPRVVKCYNYQGEGHMVRHCTQSKRLRNVSWFKEKLMLDEAQESYQILDEEQLAFLADPRIS